MGLVRIPGDAQPTRHADYSGRGYGERLAHALESFVCAACGGHGPDTIRSFDALTGVVGCRCGSFTELGIVQPATRGTR